MIYFISDGNGSIKIGYTENLKKRLIELQISSPNKLIPLYIMDGDMTMEHHVQSICSRYLVSGEWFKEEVIEKHLLKHPFYLENMHLVENQRS